MLALPAEGRGSLPAELPAASEADEVGPAFSQALAGRG